MRASPAIICTVALLLALGGCTTTPAASSSDGKSRPVVDPCSARLQDIGGTILMYYALNKHMPPTLGDAATLADVDSKMILTCPVSNLPYIYNPQGLAIPGTDKRVVVYDATPVHDGSRHCLIMTPPARGKAVTSDVQSFPEAVFATLKPAH